MRSSLVILVFLTNVIFVSAPAFSETKELKTEDFFSAKGVVTRVDLAQKVVYLKTEGGLELTFHINETSQITQGSETQSLADLAVGDEVEMEYDYNPDYEKIVRLIKKKSPPASS